MPIMNPSRQNFEPLQRFTRQVVQTASVCVVLAVSLVGWQLNRRAVAAQEAKQMRAQLLAAQREAADAQSELVQMQAGFATLQQTSTQRYEAALQAIESASAFEVWKQKTR